MGNIEKILGALIIFLMINGLFFSFPYSDIAVILLTVILSLIYFSLSFALLNNMRLRNILKKSSYKNIGALRIVGGIFTGFVLSMICIYSLFKFMRWPYANLGLQICLIGILIPVAIVLYKYLTTKSEYYKNFLFRLLIFTAIGTIFYSTPSERILEIRNRDYPEYIEAEKELMKDPENIELQQKALEERQKKI